MSYNANYPVSLDALANPTTTTNRNDLGFELHGVVGRLQDIAEALETKLGIGASAPSTAGVLRRTAAGASAWGPIQTGDLAAAAITQVLTAAPTPGQTLSGGTGVTDITGGTISMTTGASPLAVFVYGTIINSTAGAFAGLQVYVDGAAFGVEQIAMSAIANGYVPFAIAAIGSISAVAHTIKLRWRDSVGSNTATLFLAAMAAVELKV